MKYLTLLTIIADGIFGDILKEILKILMYIPNLLFLVVDGIIYSVLAYAYKLFEIMARLNFMSIKTWFDPILENIKQLTIVVVMFAIGYALINYLINPDKINEGKIGGMALIKNIAIAGVLFIAVEVFFPLMNETTFLLIGAPEGYTYSSVLEQFGVSNDGGPGLIANVIYGKSSNEEQEDFGKILSLRTLNTFLHSKYGASVLDKVYKEAYEGKDFNLMGITAGFKDIEVFEEDGTKTGSIEYKYPVLSSIVGLFIIYILVTISIELGIRALKLIILEILAPIAIVTIIKDGWDAKVWKNWLSVYWKTYADVFLRVASMYMVVGLISKVFNNVSDLLSSSAKSGSFTTYIVMIIIVIAGFKLAKELPKFIDSILGSKLADNNKNGFGNFLKGIGTGLSTATGVAAGGIGGFATGIAASKANGLSASAGAWNAIKGGIGGAVAGSKGKKISDHINNINKHKEGIRTNAEAMKSHGGTLRSNAAYGFRQATGLNYVGQKRTERAIKAENDSYSQQQWVHDQNVHKLSEAHESAVQGHQDNINKYQESIRTKTEAMQKADSSIIDSRTGSAIKFDENYMQNAVDGDSLVRAAKSSLAEKQERLKTLIQSGASKAAIDIQQSAIDNAENQLALATQTATQNAISVKQTYEDTVGITADKNALRAAQNALNKENSDYTTDMRTENDSFKAITEAHENTIKGTIDATTGKRSGGLEKELKHYGGKPQ